MAGWNRLGLGVFWFGLVTVLGLIASTLMTPPGPALRGTSHEEEHHEVAVFFSGREEWDGLTRALDHCVERGLAQRVARGSDWLRLKTPKSERVVEWRLYPISETAGVLGTETGGDPPIAIVGSDKSAPSAMLAEVLNSARESLGDRTPVLLLPWASALKVDPPGGVTPADGGRELLEIYSGRTFRFCANNRSEAEAVVHCLAGLQGEPEPGSILILDDRGDPYAHDLASAFAGAVPSEWRPRIEGLEVDLAMPEPGLEPDEPGEPERVLVNRVLNRLKDLDSAQNLWVVVPLQGNATRRVIRAMDEKARLEGNADRIRVVCGDGIGVTTLEELAGKVCFPIWCVSTSTAPGDDLGLEEDVQIPAEIAASLLWILDQDDFDPANLADAMAELELGPRHPASMGRPLSFDSHGERSAGSSGHVLAIAPTRPGVWAFAPQSTGGWDSGRPIRRH